MIPIARSSCLLSDDSANRISRGVWWTNKEFSSVDIIPPWFYIPLRHVGDEQ
jgi:hypothetical protein